MKYYILLANILFTACDRTYDTKVARPMTINSAYGPERGTPDVNRLKIALEGLPMYSRIKDKVDFSSAELLTSKEENILIYIIRFIGNTDKVYAVKGMIAKTLVIHDEVL